MRANGCLRKKIKLTIVNKFLLLLKRIIGFKLNILRSLWAHLFLYFYHYVTYLVTLIIIFCFADIEVIANFFSYVDIDIGIYL